MRVTRDKGNFRNRRLDRERETLSAFPRKNYRFFEFLFGFGKSFTCAPKLGSNGIEVSNTLLANSLFEKVQLRQVTNALANLSYFHILTL